MASADTSPLVLYGRRRSVARLRSGALLLESGGVRREIPVSAIERVDVRGRRGRELVVVLTSASPGRAAYALTSGSAPAVREFAEAVRRALPVRAAGEPSRDGAALVTVTPMERPGLEPRNVARWALGGLAAALFGVITVLLVARDAGEQAQVSWLLSPMMTTVGVLPLRGGLRMVRDALVLGRRGIVVAGRLVGTYELGDGDDRRTEYVYAYEDALGEPHRRSGPEGGGVEVEILYDPDDPGGTAKVGRGTVGHLLAGLLLALLLGAPMTAIGLEMVATGLAPLFA
ncbi:hypothetical protein [Streptomyces sp. NK08204]|uniref:hypothetical protein n=1 Tax=Streptomyces sp. NK08204 TaxID=2873260 RepID=UPI001CEC988D|nr:hypothetical protein [Streptomyces sp. NK08204]